MQEDLQGSRNGFQIFQDDRCPALGGTSVTSKNAYPQTRRIAHDNLPAQGDNRDMFTQELSISKAQRILWPVGAGMAGAMLLTALYFGIVSWAESPDHAIDLFWEDRWIVIPIILGFGVQMALYTILKKRLFIPVANPGPSGALTGAGGTTSHPGDDCLLCPSCDGCIAYIGVNSRRDLPGRVSDLVYAGWAGNDPGWDRRHALHFVQGA